MSSKEDASDGHGASLQAPAHLWGVPAAGWRRIADGMRSATKRHHASVLAGGVAFFAFLSMFPALVALVSAYGLLADPHDVKRQVEAFAGGLPKDVQEAIYHQMSQLTARSSGTLSVEAGVSLVAAVWAATKGTKALITGLSLAFGQDETRGFIRLNLTAFLFTFGGIVFGVIAVAAVILFPIILTYLHLSRLREVLVTWLRWPVLIAVVQFGLAVAYHYGPARPPQRWRWITPGSVVATALWIGGSALFSWFMSFTAASDRLDGGLGVIITILTWFLLSAYVVILGAELDTEIERQKARAAPDVDIHLPVPK